ncbi:MAG: AMP-binding protein, partial [Actinomycetota bacterium]|nr:AMP-binding protein [Actinomycetota bacterium]
MSAGLTIAHGRSLSRELRQRADRQPDRTWLTFQPLDAPATTVTYGQFAELVDRCANVLVGLGIRPGVKILIVLGNCPEFLLLWFGAARVGGVIVPANPQASDAELEYLASHSESMIVALGVGDEERGQRLRNACSALRHVLVCGAPAGAKDGFDGLMDDSSATAPRHEPQSDDEVAILYTSGTTSRPKGCLITNANYIHVGEAVAQHIGVTDTDRHLIVLPYFHGNAQYYSTMSALIAGASIVVAERFSASRFWSIASEHETTLVSLFAAPMRMLLAQPDREIPAQNLRLAFFAQNITTAQLAEWDRRFHVPLLQIYGMTEQLGWPVANPMYGHRDNMTIGRPTLPFRCRVVDDDDRNVPDGVSGSLLVQGVPGVSLMKGYLKYADLTSATMR